MSKNHRKNLKHLELRARLPKIFRVAAVVVFMATVLGIGIGFYRARNNQEFRMKGFPTELSKDVIAEINGYERTETDGAVKKYFIKADKAVTFADNHQELENVFLQVFDTTGEKSDQITANKAIYIPAENKNFTAYFSGQVHISTRDDLKVKTEQLTYNKENEIAEAEEAVEFERENIAGKSFGAIVKVAEKKVELLKDVEISSLDLEESNEAGQSNLKSTRFSANRAIFDQPSGKIELSENVHINILPNKNNENLTQPTDINADQATAFFTEKQIRQIDLNGNVEVFQKPTPANAKWTRTRAGQATAKINKELKKLELFENVEIETTTNDAQPTKINSGTAVYEKDNDRFDLKKNVKIITNAENQPTTIVSNEAVYEQSNGKIFLFGNIEIDNGREYLKGDAVTADLLPDRNIKNALIKGNAYLKQTSAERIIEISAAQLNASFNENQKLQSADAVGNGTAILIPSKSNEYTKVNLNAAQAIRVSFKGEGLLSEMQTDGRTTIQLNAPDNSPDAAHKRLTADSVKTFFNANGKDMSRAEAVGNAELFVEPLRASPQNYQTKINAPRFDCDFYPTGNNAKTCTATAKTKTIRIPTVQREGRGAQNLTAEKLSADFDQKTQDIARFEATGTAKFTELRRNGVADRITFTANDQIVRLRGGEPTVWDNRGRAKAPEIDWDTGNDLSKLQGGVSTTYYNQKQTNGATPFEQENKPVYLTAEIAEFKHKEEIAFYSGNARAWQENNYVRADRLLIRQKQGQLYADGKVQSLLYSAKRQENGRETTVPVYVSANKLFYARENNLLRYEEDVDIRQSTERITAEIANIFLTDSNDLLRLIVEKNVVVNSPNRRATGDFAQYNAADESVIIRGNPARLEDTENGSSQGAQVTVFLRDKRVFNDSKTPQNNTGRIRTVYKVKNQE